jgi:hypothetical protein
VSVDRSIPTPATRRVTFGKLYPMRTALTASDLLDDRVLSSFDIGENRRVVRRAAALSREIARQRAALDATR